MARYQNRAQHDLALLGRLNVRFIRRHLAKTIKRDERGFYYSQTQTALLLASILKPGERLPRI
jgi:hypothetical protein